MDRKSLDFEFRETIREALFAELQTRYPQLSLSRSEAWLMIQLSDPIQPSRDMVIFLQRDRISIDMVRGEGTILDSSTMHIAMSNVLRDGGTFYYYEDPELLPQIHSKIKNWIYKNKLLTRGQHLQQLFHNNPKEYLSVVKTTERANLARLSH